MRGTLKYAILGLCALLLVATGYYLRQYEEYTRLRAALRSAT